MGEEPGRRRRRVRPSHPAPSASAPPADAATDPAGPPLTAAPALGAAAAEPMRPSAEAVPEASGAVAETSPVLDPDDGPKPSTMRPGPIGGRAPRPTGPAPGARPAAPGSGTGAPGARPSDAGAPSGGAPGAGASGQGLRPAGPRAAGEEPAERGLRGLVGSGSSQVSVGAAMRARDAARPSDEHLADADRNLTIVRRNWVPREDLPRGR